MYFYDGLLLMERYMIDATSGRSLENKTPQQAQTLIYIMAKTTRNPKHRL